MTQISPRVDNTKNSDWFKSAVLFWKSQGDSEDNFSERCKSPLSPRSSPRKQMPIITVSKPERGKIFCKKNETLKSNNISFDEEELLNQVKELEEFLSNQSSDYERSDCHSPHLTTEFPEGSFIKSNPLFETENNIVNFTAQNNVTRTMSSIESCSSQKIYDQNEVQRKKVCPCHKNTCMKKKETKLESLSKEKESVEKLCSCGIFENNASQTELRSSPYSDESLSLKSELNEANTFDNIQKVQDTLEEISREIISSKEKIKQHRDPNEIMSKLLSTIKPPNESKPSYKSISQNLSYKPQNFIDKSAVTEEELLQKSAILLQQIDELVKAESDHVFNKSEKFQVCLNSRERLDSGIHSKTNSTVNSPYQSPSFGRSEKSSSERSRTSTLEALRNNLEKAKCFTPVDFDTDFSDKSLSGENSKNYELEKHGVSKFEPELVAVKKFIRLTDDLKERKSEISSENCASIPSLQTAIELHRRELQQQREKQEEFLQQLGDLLLEIVNLKDEQMAVRMKQTKALSLMKKQLDIQKKNQTQAHTDVLTQVQSIHERLNSNVNKRLDHDSNQVRAYALPPHSNHQQVYGETIWKVTDVMKKLHRAKSGLIDGTLVSSPFHTSQYGYKMNGWLYLNGRGKSAGSYLSVYVCVLVGEYDAILPWPFKPCYKFTLIDQRADILKRKDHVKIRRVVDIAGRDANIITQFGGIPRPVNSTKALIVGYDDFIAHEQLSSRFLVDDTLFLKIEVEANGI